MRLVYRKPSTKRKTKPSKPITYPNHRHNTPTKSRRRHNSIRHSKRRRRHRRHVKILVIRYYSHRPYRFSRYSYPGMSPFYMFPFSPYSPYYYRRHYYGGYSRRFGRCRRHRRRYRHRLHLYKKKH